MAHAIDFDFSDCCLPKAALAQAAGKLAKYRSELSDLQKSPDWSHPACSILLADEGKFEKECSSLLSKAKKPTLLIVIGIGGSNLGSLAAMRAVLHNPCTPSHKPQVLFADTVDPRTISYVISSARTHLSEGGHVLINAISKSGTTLETLVNFDVIYSALKKSSSGQLNVVITSDDGSEFERVAQEEGFHSLPIPKNVGGRYSVLSSAGLFPLMAAGFDTHKFLEGARLSLKGALSADLRKNPVALAAAFLFLEAKAGRKIHVDFMFSNSLRSLGSWHRQLIGESLGKEKNESGSKIVHSGITPLVCTGTTDLHSMGQLFLGGPADKSYRFVSVQNFGEDFEAGSSQFLAKLAPFAKGKKASRILNALCEGTKEAYRKNALPFVSISLPALDEHSIGQLMQMEMVEAMYAAKLFGVNAFDQPAVEKYKREARKILGA
ncbi:MAG: hypothetical protein V1822_01785 [Candidatus Micrarchaeota archaeon]